ncbi:LOW QUALITY PROTEIN: hypothetical protein PHMEG_00034770 [Phytophthora megakarya]|uniref:Integrase zinc-binding domain-containing protein n=1 Tax=Phytophthora megakarya TaxID=4795 RepID=A0A225UQL9_9STRA|nr:LOW QUALITY PROTEIN: hypothetical protein PHMEG_00034770 [Phytophthora megakarya]
MYDTRLTVVTPIASYSTMATRGTTEPELSVDEQQSIQLAGNDDDDRRKPLYNHEDHVASLVTGPRQQVTIPEDEDVPQRRTRQQTAEGRNAVPQRRMRVDASVDGVTQPTDVTTTQPQNLKSKQTTARQRTKTVTVEMNDKSTYETMTTTVSPKQKSKAALRSLTEAQKTTMEQRRNPTYHGSTMTTLQLTDETIITAQKRSRLVQRMLMNGGHRGMKVIRQFELVLIETKRGRRIILPPELWAIAFKESHDSAWAGHLRAPHTYERISRVYWWPDLFHEVSGLEVVKIVEAEKRDPEK